MAGVLQYALSLKTGGFTGPAKGAQGAMGGMTGAATSMLGPLAKAAAAVAALGGAALGLNAFRSGIKGAFDLGGSLSDLSAQTGINVRELAILQQAFKDNGLAAGQVGPAVNRLQKALAGVSEDGQPTAKIFEKLGLNMDELSGLSAAGQLDKVGGAIRKIQDPAQRTAAAMAIFGRTGGEMLTLFADSGAISNATKTLGGQAELLEKNATKFDRASDLLGSSGTKMQGFFVGVADKVISGILPLLEAFNSLDLSGLGQQVGEIISTLGQGFSTIFSIFRTESDASFTDMLGDALRVTQELATRFVGAVEILKSAIEQGKLGEMLSLSLQLGAMTAANALLSGFITTIDLIGRYFHFQLKQLVTVFTGGFNGAIGSVFSALPKLIGGMGVLIYAKLSGPFQEVAAIFSAGLAKGLDLLKQGISKIPGLNKVFGLKDFKATSFEQLLGEMRSSGDTETAARMGDEMLGEGMDKLRKGLGQMGEVVTGNFKEAFAGFKPSQLKLFETDETQAALKDLAKSIDPAAFEKLTAPAAAIAKASKDSLTAAREVARTPSPATPPKPPPVSKKSVEALANLRGEMELIAAKAAGDRKRVSALNREAAIKKGLESGLSLADATKKARLDQAVSTATNPESHQERRDRERAERKESRNILREYKKLPKGNEDGALNRLLTPAAAAEQLGRGGAAADPGRVRREERAEAARVKTDPLFRIVKAIEEKFDNLVTA